MRSGSSPFAGSESGARSSSRPQPASVTFLPAFGFRSLRLSASATFWKAPGFLAFPAGTFAAPEINHGSHAEPALAGFEASNVAGPQLVGSGGRGDAWASRLGAMGS